MNISVLPIWIRRPLGSLILSIFILGLGCSTRNTGAVIQRQDPTLKSGTRDTTATAHIKGTFCDYKTKRPISNQYLYLGELISRAGDGTMVFGTDVKTSFKSLTDSKGRFSFVNIPVKKTFALATVAPTGRIILLIDPVTHKEYVLETTKGGKINMKTIYIDLSFWQR